MEKNVGKLDRIMRLLFGILLIYIAYIIFNNILILSMVLGILGAIAIIESFIGYCGLYKLFKINTNRM